MEHVRDPGLQIPLGQRDYAQLISDSNIFPCSIRHAWLGLESGESSTTGVANGIALLKNVIELFPRDQWPGAEVHVSQTEIKELHDELIKNPLSLHDDDFNTNGPDIVIPDSLKADHPLKNRSGQDVQGITFYRAFRESVFFTTFANMKAEMKRAAEDTQPYTLNNFRFHRFSFKDPVGHEHFMELLYSSLHAAALDPAMIRHDRAGCIAALEYLHNEKPWCDMMPGFTFDLSKFKPLKKNIFKMENH